MKPLAARPYFFARALSLAGTLLASIASANLENGVWTFHGPRKSYTFKSVSAERGSAGVYLEDIAKEFKLKLELDPKNFQLKITNARGDVDALWTIDTRQVKILGATVHLSRPLRYDGARPIVGLDFADRVLTPLLTEEAPRPATESKLKKGEVDVVLDPGHGGNDWGTGVEIAKKLYKEKDLSLAIAQELQKELGRRGVRAALTREDDTYLSLPERTLFANHVGAKLFLSLHLNFDPAQKRRGYEIYLLNLDSSDGEARKNIAEENQIIPEDLSEGVEKALAQVREQSNFESSLRWAKALTHAIHAQVPAPRAVKAGPFYVLYGVDAPALLLELGFVSHPQDMLILTTPENRKQLVADIADGIATTLKPAKVAIKPAYRKRK